MTRGDGAGRAKLSARIGGLPVFAAAINRTLDHLAWMPGFGQVFEAIPTSVHALRTAFCEEIEALLDLVDDEAAAEGQRLRQKVATAFAGLYFSDGHFSVFIEHFRGSLQHLDVDEDSITEAEARLQRLRPEATAAYRAALERATGVCNAAWRRELSEAVGPERLAAFADFLWDKVRHVPVLRQSPYASAAGPEPFEHKLAAWLESEDWETDIGPIPLPDRVALGKEVSHLVFINATHEALQQAGFSVDAMEVLRALMLREWSRVY